jgi:EpsI family protein
MDGCFSVLSSSAFLYRHQVSRRLRFGAGTATLPEGSGLIGYRPSVGAMAAFASVALVVACLWLPERAIASVDGEATRELLPIVAKTDGVVSKSPRWLATSVLRPSQCVAAGLERQGERVVVYIAYYASQRQDQELINSANILVPAENRLWREVARGRTDLDWNGTRIEVRSARIAKSDAGFDVVWWYWIDGSTTTSATRAKGMLALTRLQRRPDDSAAIFLYTEPSDRRNSADLLRAFGSDMGGSIERCLISTRNRAVR